MDIAERLVNISSSVLSLAALGLLIVVCGRTVVANSKTLSYQKDVCGVWLGNHLNRRHCR